MITVTAHMLGVVHRRIGVKHQFALGFAVVRIQRNTNAKGHHQLIRIQIERAINRAYQRVGEGGRIVRAFCFCEQHKFITANTCKRELAFQGEQQALRNGHQQLIADIMTVGVIDGFKTVEIHEHQCEMRTLTVCFVDGLVESVFQQDTIGQARQRILQCQLSQLPVSFCQG